MVSIPLKGKSTNRQIIMPTTTLATVCTFHNISEKGCSSFNYIYLLKYLTHIIVCDVTDQSSCDVPNANIIKQC
jgi:hypothetical protein